MTTPHDPQGTDREDELLRAVLAEEDAAEEVEHGRRDPISPVARDRLRSGTAAAPAPQERPSVEDVYGAVDRVRAVPEASAPGAVIGDAGVVPERTPAPSATPAAPPATHVRPSAQAFVGADAETPDAVRAPRPRPAVRSSDAPAPPQPAPAPTTRPAPTPASPDETAVPVARPASSESAPATAAPAPAASPESEPLAPAAVPTDDPAGHGARRRTALLLGALVLLALIAVVLAIVLN